MDSIRLSTLALLFSLSSCSIAPVVSAIGCSTQAMWLSGAPITGEEFFIEESLWLTPGDEQIPLRDILERHDISCASVQTLSMGWKTSASDSLVSFVPFIQKKTLQLRGTKTSFTDEDQTREGAN
jgi:hypothetical protein